MKKNIYAGIVVYKPEEKLVNLVKKLLDQNANPILFINEGNKITDRLLSNSSIIYFISKENVGISEALNNIIKYFLASNAEYLLTFDQDSEIPNNFVQSMINLFQKARDNDKNIICCAPKIIDVKFSRNRMPKSISNEDSANYSYVNFAITSGSLFIKKSFNAIGLMNPLLFIDGVDTDWCERLLLKKYKLVMADNIFLLHKVGSKFIQLFGITKSYHDQDLRVYYIIRNSVYLLLRGSNTFKWKLKESLRTFIRVIVYPVLSSTRRKTFYYLFLAIRDGVIMKMGKMKYINH